MELETLTVVMAVAGLILLYGAVTNRNPLEVIQLAIQGKDISAASPISTAGDRNPDNLPGAIPGDTLDPGEFNPAPDGEFDEFDPNYDPDRDYVLPNPPGPNQQNPGLGAVQYRRPYNMRSV